MLSGYGDINILKGVDRWSEVRKLKIVLRSKKSQERHYLYLILVWYELTPWEDNFVMMFTINDLYAFRG